MFQHGRESVDAVLDVVKAGLHPQCCPSVDEVPPEHGPQLPGHALHHGVRTSLVSWLQYEQHSHVHNDRPVTKDRMGYRVYQVQETLLNPSFIWDQFQQLSDCQQLQTRGTG